MATTRGDDAAPSGLTTLSVPAFADTYQVTFGWTDPTTYIPSDAPVLYIDFEENKTADAGTPFNITFNASGIVLFSYA